MVLGHPSPSPSPSPVSCSPPDSEGRDVSWSHNGHGTPAHRLDAIRGGWGAARPCAPRGHHLGPTPKGAFEGRWNGRGVPARFLSIHTCVSSENVFCMSFRSGLKNVRCFIKSARNFLAPFKRNPSVPDAPASAPDAPAPASGVLEKEYYLTSEKIGAVVKSIINK